MNNYRNSLITESNTFSDEFEGGATVTIENAVADVSVNVSDEEREFNSRIHGNFDRIINYNATASEATNSSDVYSRTYVDDKPTATTMQFKNVAKTEIYEDLKIDGDYETASKVRMSAKAIVMVFTAIILALCVLIVFNTALLNNMNSVIDGKYESIQTLKEEVEVKYAELEQASDDERVIEAAKEYGMVEGN